VIIAVVGAVTVPSDGNAYARSLAPEVLLLIALIRLNGGTAELVGAVVTVGDAVALVVLFDTLPQVRTLELIRRAGYRGTVLLVLLVKTVVVTCCGILRF
jgi:hypothetical protein